MTHLLLVLQNSYKAGHLTNFIIVYGNNLGQCSQTMIKSFPKVEL